MVSFFRGSNQNRFIQPTPGLFSSTFPSHRSQAFRWSAYRGWQQASPGRRRDRYLRDSTRRAFSRSPRPQKIGGLWVFSAGNPQDPFAGRRRKSGLPTSGFRATIDVLPVLDDARGKGCVANLLTALNPQLTVTRRCFLPAKTSPLASVELV